MMPRFNRERGFNAIRVKVPNRVHAKRVIDLLMLTQNVSVLDGFAIHVEIVGHNHVNVLRDVFLDVLRQRAGLHILSAEEPQIAATLPNPNDNLFLGAAPALMVASPFARLSIIASC